MALDKSSWSKTIKVSQSQIDAIKSQGMTASLKKAALSGNASYVEGVKRLYGANRLAAATKAVKAAPPTPGGVSTPKASSSSMARPGVYRGNPTSKMKDSPASKNNPSGKKTAPLGNYRGSSGKVPTAAAEASGKKVLKTAGTVALGLLAARAGGGAAMGSVARSNSLKPIAQNVGKFSAFKARNTAESLVSKNTNAKTVARAIAARKVGEISQKELAVVKAAAKANAKAAAKPKVKLPLSKKVLTS